MEIKFKCPECDKYVKLIGELLPIREELELYCENCKKETVILATRPLSWEHTVQEDFEHFLSYSGLWREEQPVKDKLFIAYESAWQSSCPTPLAPDAATPSPAGESGIS
jgi:hypothetical protein